MVARSFTAVVERNVTFTGDFATEPYEAGWAREARWFIHVLAVSGQNSTASIKPQLSPDGLHWCDEGQSEILIASPGLYSFPVREFGNWLRLTGHVSGEKGGLKVIIYLALKE